MTQEIKEIAAKILAEKDTKDPDFIHTIARMLLKLSEKTVTDKKVKSEIK